MKKQITLRTPFVMAVLAAGLLIGSSSARAANFVVTNTEDTGSGSLRDAINQANANPGFDEISFNIRGEGPQFINILSSPLPAIVETVFIDGWTQGGPSYEGPPLIGLAYSTESFGNTLLLSGADGRTATGSTIRGLTVTVFLEAPQLQAGIQVGEFDVPVDNVTIQGCELDTFNRTGIAILSGSHHLIGGTTDSQRNLFLSNHLGLYIFSDHNRVEGNHFGLQKDGTCIGGLTDIGVIVVGSHNIIGGTSPNTRNTIATRAFGVSIENGSHNVVEGNYIGADLNGAVCPTSFGFVDIEISGHSTSKNQIGGASPSAGNLIVQAAINFGHSIVLDDGTSENTIQNNLIDNGGMPGDVVLIANGNYNQIGGTAKIEAPGGPPLFFPAGNTIHHTQGRGVVVMEGIGNLISQNSIYGSDLGIDLLGDGVTSNDDCDVDDGPNRLQNFPVVLSVSTSGIGKAGSTTITGAVFSRGPAFHSFPPHGVVYQLEFFSNPSCSGRSDREGTTFIGSTSVMLTGNSCSVPFTVTFDRTLPFGSFVTATATGPKGNTSEFSECVQAIGS